MTQPPPAAPARFETLLASSWALFTRNWIVAAPMFIAALVFIVAIGAFAGIVIAAAISSGLLAHAEPGAGFIALAVILYLVLLIGGLALGLWALCATFGMADAVWERGTATFADGNAAFRSRAGAMIVALIGVTGLAIVAFILALPTLGLSLLALPLFTMYVMPAVVAGGRGGFDAISDSFKLVRWNFVPSIITALVLYAISYGISFIALIPIFPLEFAVLPNAGDPSTLQMPPLPLLFFGGAGYLAAIALSLAYQGYYAIALTGTYRALLAQPPRVAVVPAGPPAV